MIAFDPIRREGERGRDLTQFVLDGFGVGITSGGRIPRPEGVPSDVIEVLQ